MASSAWTGRASWNGFSRNYRCASRWDPARRNSLRWSSMWTRRRGLRDGRLNGAAKMVEKLNAMGVRLDFARVRALAQGAVGRPHVARALVEAGVVSSTEEAFEKYLGRNGPAYVERMKLSPPEAVQVILRTGGIPVLAHPGWGVKDEVIPALAESGLEGLEVYYPDHTPAMVTRYFEIAKRVRLLVTGRDRFLWK